jgi:transposase
MQAKRFSDWKEARRWRGVELFQEGWRRSEIAEALGVSRNSVSRWIRAYRNGGKKSLRSVPRCGAPTRLSAEKKYQILELLYPGAEAWGFLGDVWTCSRIAKIVEKHFGVTYHSHHIAKIMEQLNWTSHMPRSKALQRDERAIANWVHRKWPAIKKSDKRGKSSISPRRIRDLSIAGHPQYLPAER